MSYWDFETPSHYVAQVGLEDCFPALALPSDGIHMCTTWLAVANLLFVVAKHAEVLFFSDRISPCSPGWLRIYIDQASTAGSCTSLRLWWD